MPARSPRPTATHQGTQPGRPMQLTCTLRYKQGTELQHDSQQLTIICNQKHTQGMPYESVSASMKNDIAKASVVHVRRMTRHLFVGDIRLHPRVHRQGVANRFWKCLRMGSMMLTPAKPPKGIDHVRHTERIWRPWSFWRSSILPWMTERFGGLGAFGGLGGLRSCLGCSRCR